MAKGPRTKARALFQGLLTLAQFVQTPVTVIAQLGSFGKHGPAQKNARGSVISPKGKQRRHTRELHHFTSARTRAHPMRRRTSHTDGEDKGTQHWQHGRGPTPSMTSMQKPGNAPWTRTTWRSTHMLQPALRKSLIHSTTSTTNQAAMLATRPSNTRSGSSNNVGNHGSQANIGSRTAVDTNAIPARPITVETIETRLKQDCDQLTHEAYCWTPPR